MSLIDLEALAAVETWLWENPPGKVGSIAVRELVLRDLRDITALVARQERDYRLKKDPPK